MTQWNEIYFIGNLWVAVWTQTRAFCFFGWMFAVCLIHLMIQNAAINFYIYVMYLVYGTALYFSKNHFNEAHIIKYAGCLVDEFIGFIWENWAFS